MELTAPRGILAARQLSSNILFYWSKYTQKHDACHNHSAVVENANTWESDALRAEYPGRKSITRMRIITVLKQAEIK